MTKITLVKKIKADGTACAKCAEIADERDPASEGMRLAARYHVERAPFFIVERAGEPAQIYTVYLRLLREVLQREGDERAEVAELMRSGGLDFI